MNMNTVIADHIHYRAHGLHENSSEHPENTARNNAAAAEMGELETQFRNDDTDEELLAEFAETLGEIDGAATQTQVYGVMLDSIGFQERYNTPDDFLTAAITEMKRGTRHIA